MQAMPITAAYLPIVYSDIVYADYLPLLTRMLFLANACIQWAVAGMSSMHCAIGQVQVRCLPHWHSNLFWASQLGSVSVSSGENYVILQN